MTNEPRDRARVSGPAPSALPPRTHKVTLTYPINVGGVETNVVVLRRPTIRDQMNIQRAMPNSPEGEREIAFIGNLCELAPDEVESLDIGDYMKLQDLLTSFTRSATSKA